MKDITNLIGICLIIIGIVALAYKGITYTKHETVAQIGNIEVTADTQKNIYFSPILGGACLIGGIALVLLARSNRLK